MSDQIEKIESGRWSDGRYLSLPFTPEQVAINTLIDHIHALEKRVEEIESWYCHCPTTMRRTYDHGICIDCKRMEHP